MRYAAACAVVCLLSICRVSLADKPGNLALAATAATSYVSGHETIHGLNSGFDPRDSGDKRHGAYGNWPRHGTQWVEYAWSRPIHTGRVEVYWFDDHRGVRLPTACRLKYFDGKKLVAVKNAKGFGLSENQYNTTTFDAVHTTRLRLEMVSGDESTGILQWRVIDAGDSPPFPPQVTAGPDRAVVLPGKTWLSGSVRDVLRPGNTATVQWSKASGPGKVTFDDSAALETSAAFSERGAYVLELATGDGEHRAADTLRVDVVPAPPAEPLRPVTMSHYTVTSPLLRARLKQVIIHWIPHCYEKLSEAKLPEGGIENFVQAGNKLAGRPFQRHRGAPWTNAYVHNTVESMCWALLFDPQSDAEIIAAQDAIRKKLDDWIPKILSAQEPSGYLQTMYTLNGLKPWTNKGDHEGYTAGYFIETAIAHYVASGKHDDRMLRAARRLADCWYDHIGPAPKKTWYDGHEELEQALVRLADTVDSIDGPHQGDKYVELAKFLLDSRHDGAWYDQSHLPVTRQYEAAGHAVRAAYLYSGMAGVAMKTRDVDYLSATLSQWENIVNKRYYVTGGIGSGETAEGFGPNYSLPNNAYCESCANCGLLFFENKMNAIFQNSHFADLYEDTYYNAILGDVDLDAKNFTYTNALDSSEKRYPWHACPCCVGNIPRTLLQLPTWMYATSKDGVYVNIYAGSKVSVGNVAGTEVEIEQITDYPWKDEVTIMVRPAVEKRFTIHLRQPYGSVSPFMRYTSISPLYRTYANWYGDAFPPYIVGHFEEPPKLWKDIPFQGQQVNDEYQAIDATWKKGDFIHFRLDRDPHRIKADERIAADRGRVALRYGPLIYCIESVDQDVEEVLPPDAPLTSEWRPDLLGGVAVIKSTFASGRPMLAIPYYARANRGGRSVVWMREK